MLRGNFCTHTFIISQELLRLQWGTRRVIICEYLYNENTILGQIKCQNDGGLLLVIKT